MLQIVAIYFILCLIVATLGIGHKWTFCQYLLASLLLTPIIGLLLVLASDKKPAPLKTTE